MVTFEDLQFGLKEKNFELTEAKDGFEVRPTGKHVPVWEFAALDEVQHFFNGLEAMGQVA